MKSSLTLSLLPGRFAICRLASEAETPAWAWNGSFSSVTRTPEEISIVCDEWQVPGHIRAERGRKLLRVHGPIPFSMTGVLASLAVPLADAGISIFAVSTFDTDYLLISERDVGPAIAALDKAGHTIHRS